MSKKITNKEVHDTCKLYDLEWIDREYIEAKKPIVCKDKNGYKLLVALSNLKSWNGATSPFHTSNPYTIDNIKTLLLNYNSKITLLATEYKGNNIPLSCKCQVCNYEWNVSLSHLQKKSGCPRCANALKLSIDIVKERVYKINPNIKILDTDLKNTSSKLHCKCLVKTCGHEWNPICSHLLAGRGCPKCGIYINNSDGLYNSTLAERNKEKWINKKAIVYVVECFNEFELFYKIGVTNRNISKRFSGNLPYKYNVVETIFTNMYDATYIEEVLHNHHQEYLYEPLIKFDGYTECFSTINNNKILSVKNGVENLKYDINYKTSCYINIDNVKDDIRSLQKQDLIILMIKLNAYLISYKDLALSEEYKLSGYKLEDWISDIKAKIETLSRKDRERNLKVMEDKLTAMLSNEKQVELELDEITNLLKGS